MDPITHSATEFSAYCQLAQSAQTNAQPLLQFLTELTCH